MSEKIKIEPELFKVSTKNIDIYVIAYDIIHAMKCVSNNYWLKESPGYEISVTQLTTTTTFGNELKVAKECLPQGLVTKIINKDE